MPIRTADRSSPGTYRYAPLGLLGLLALIALVGLCVASYRQVFSPGIPLTVHAPRSGLLTEPGAPVKLNGVVVGRVTQVTTNGNGASVGLTMDPSTMPLIPAGVSVSIVPPTLFGAKYVDLVPPAESVPAGTAPIAAGAVVGPARVTEEINGTFEQLVATLDSLPAAKLNAALSAVAGTLNGNGERLGRVLATADDYLNTLNPHLPALVSDLRPLSATAKNLAVLTPALVSTLDNAGHTATTLVQRRHRLALLLATATRLGTTGEHLLGDNAGRLADALGTLEPTSAQLAEFAPIERCLLAGLVRNDQLITAAIGGPEPGDAQLGLPAATAQLAPGMRPYRDYPNALPRVGLTNPPSCYGLPVLVRPAPFTQFDTGPIIYPQTTDRSSLGRPPVALAPPSVQQPASAPPRSGR